MHGSTEQEMENVAEKISTGICWWPKTQSPIEQIVVLSSLRKQIKHPLLKDCHKKVKSTPIQFNHRNHSFYVLVGEFSKILCVLIKYQLGMHQLQSPTGSLPNSRTGHPVGLGTNRDSGYPSDWVSVGTLGTPRTGYQSGLWVPLGLGISRDSGYPSDWVSVGTLGTPRTGYQSGLWVPLGLGICKTSIWGCIKCLQSQKLS